MEDRTLKQLLMSSSYFVLNKQIVKAIGIEAGFLLTTLIEASDGLANEDGWFYKTSPSLEEETGLSNHKQSKIIEELTKLGILEQENKGMPMKRYFRINFNKIEELVFKTQDLKNSKPCNEEIEKQGFKNFKSKDLKNLNACIKKISNNKEFNNNNLENNNLLKEKNKKEKSKNEVETYIKDLKLNDDYKQLLFRYVEYRKSIKKPIKTIVPIQKILKDFSDWFSLDEAINIAMEKEWQGLEPEWIAKYKQSKTCNNYGNKIAENKDTSQFLVDDDYIEQMNRRYGLKND
ncbi:MAG: hypothetical protein ACTTJX_04575 [Fusobacterium sp.]|uniref:hypothetical protein n=1 Tax=Fusobacterium sp. TaxID=68766 RepID=UPI003FA03BEB